MNAVLFSLIIYSFLGASYYGWGRAAAVALGTGSQKPESLFMTVWLGWSAVLFVLQLLHFMLPITAHVVTPLFLFGVVVSIFELRKEFRFSRPRPSNTVSLIFWFLLYVLIACIVTSRAMRPPMLYDAGLYYFNAVRWINTYSIVPGLGNLHGRLAFNQSFFVYAAALNFYPLFEHGRPLANSFLILLLFFSLLPSTVSIIRRPSVIFTAHAYKFAACIFILPIVIHQMVFSWGLSSSAPDLASIIIQLAVFLMFSGAIAEYVNGHIVQKYTVVVIVVLAVSLVSVKLSNLAFSAAIICCALVYTWKSSSRPCRDIFRLLLPCGALILVWIIRGFILSGAPLYPSAFGYVSFDWAVPAEKILEEASLVHSWARSPGGGPDEVMGGSWIWFRPWLLRFFGYRLAAVYPLALSGIFSFLTMLLIYFKIAERPGFVECIIFLPPIAALIFWFFTAPDIRFANAAFFLASVCSILLFLSSIQKTLPESLFAAAVIAAFFIGNVHFLAAGFSFARSLPASPPCCGGHAIPEVLMVQRETLSGLKLYVPLTGDQCWDSSLPSTPYFNPQLRLRNPKKISSGFTVEDK